MLLGYFIPYIEKLTYLIIRGKQEESNSFNLKFIKGSLLDTAELSMLQAKKEIDIFSKRSKKMFAMVSSLFYEINEEEYQRKAKKIENYFITSGKIKSEIQVSLKIVDALYRIHGSLNNFYKTIKRKKKAKIWFTQEIRDNMKTMFQHMDRAFSLMDKNINSDYTDVEISEAEKEEKEINKMRNRLKKDHIKNIDNKNYKYEASILYNDLFLYCERVGDHIFAVSSVLNEMSK